MDRWMDGYQCVGGAWVDDGSAKCEVLNSTMDGGYVPRLIHLCLTYLLLRVPYYSITVFNTANTLPE